MQDLIHCSALHWLLSRIYILPEEKKKKFRKKKKRNFYRIKHCQRIMLSGCFRPIKEPWNIPWKEVIIDPVSITLHFNAFVSIMPKYIKITQSFFIYSLAYISDFIPFQMTSESQKRYCFFLILNSVFNTGIFQT